MNPVNLRLLVLLALCAATARAQTVYKCTTDAGISYGDAPCASGKSVALEAPPPVAPSVDNTLPHQKKEAARLEAERHKREASDARQQERDARTAAAYRKKCATLRLDKKWADEDAANATEAASGRNAGKATLKARRGAEKLALECPG